MDGDFTNIPDTTDMIDTMRRYHQDKFKSLVRMHLSFELHLNTDEFDLQCQEVVYVDKGKVKKWNRLSKKMKNCTTAKGVSTPTDGNSLVLDRTLIKQLKQLKEFIMLEKNISQEGLFRKSGSVSRQNELRTLIQNNEPFDLTSGYSVHDCTTVFKSFLADLHEPVLTDAHYPAHTQIAPLCNVVDTTVNCESLEFRKKQEHLLNSVQLLLLLLPEENRLLLQDIIEMLHAISSYKDTNKMPQQNLAVLFTPHLICPRNLPAEALHYVAQTMSAIVTYMIGQGSVIFGIPAKLATDIRAYFVERKRKITMSPEQILDESISDLSTVNTIYTFVDREKTAAAHDANNTDTELAQLYAHIQSLPESSKKRRLIKQFNKQNGQGTPLQLLNSNRVKGSEPLRSAKSIGDSIKKHIFHKSISSRTPKRGPVSGSGHSTPNFPIKHPKLRVLFHSPVTKASPTCNSSETPNSRSSSMYSLKTHPLQQSTSSSLLLTPSLNLRQDQRTILTTPLARNQNNSSTVKLTCPPSMHDSGRIMSPLDNKSIVWARKELIDTPRTSIATRETEDQIELQSRYKSEPNLSLIIPEHTFDDTPITKSKSLTRKLIKGVSMGNLKFPFTPDTNKKSKSTLKGCSSEEHTCDFLGEKDLNTLKCDYGEQIVGANGEECNSVDNAKGCGTTECCKTVNPLKTHHLRICRSSSLLTSTPSGLNGRRSMSPITKSTQRMPRAMQESILTPRSRKPVMIASALGSSEQIQISNRNDGCPDENGEGSLKDPPTEILQELPTLRQTGGTLSDNFREYLLSRSVLTASPVDSSFSSHPDDFCSTQDIEDLNESRLSPNLLYCLDGNYPVELDDGTDRGSGDRFGSFGSGRKRTAKTGALEDQENCMRSGNDDTFLKSKKMFIVAVNKSPGETSF